MILETIPKKFPKLKLTHKRVYTPKNQTLLLKRKKLSPSQRKLEKKIPFTLVADKALAYNTFISIYHSLPIYSGYLIIFGIKRNEKVSLKVIQSTNNLRHEFRENNISESRWNWCMDQLNGKGYKSLEFQLAKEK